MFEVGQKVRVVKTDKLKGKDIAPRLKMGSEEIILGICLDSKGNQHLDVGIVSKISYVTSFETGEELPDGDKIHWCHPSRFELINN